MKNHTNDGVAPRNQEILTEDDLARYRAAPFRATGHWFGSVQDPRDLPLQCRLTYLVGFEDGAGELIAQSLQSVMPRSSNQLDADYEMPDLEPRPGFPARIVPLNADAFSLISGMWFDESFAPKEL